jgi:hypothetical protein
MDDNQNQLPEVVEAEVVQGDLTAPEGAEELLNLTGLIKTYISKIAGLEESMHKASEMLNDILESSETFREHSKLAKEAAGIKSKTRQQIMSQPQAKDLDAKLKDAKSSIKEMKQTLSEYLTDYSRITGSTEFEDETGQLHKIVYVAKLVKG